MITAKESRFADGFSAKLTERGYLVDPDGWHPIPHSCMAIPTLCTNMHATLHGGLEV